jgi:hypothetical protein
MFPKGPDIRKIEAYGHFDSKIHNKLINISLIGFAIKALIALTCIISGIVFSNQGLNSETTLTIKLNGLDLELNKTAPGIVFLVFGVVLLLFSKINIKFKNNGKV